MALNLAGDGGGGGDLSRTVAHTAGPATRPAPMTPAQLAAQQKALASIPQPKNAATPGSKTATYADPTAYNNGITLPGMLANNAPGTYKPVWDPITGTWGLPILSDGALAPIYSQSQWQSVQKSLANTNEATTGMGGTIHVKNKGGGYTDVSYKLDPKTGYYIPSGAQGGDAGSWWQQHGADIGILTAAAIATAGASLPESVAALSTDAAATVGADAAAASATTGATLSAADTAALEAGAASATDAAAGSMIASSMPGVAAAGEAAGAAGIADLASQAGASGLSLSDIANYAKGAQQVYGIGKTISNIIDPAKPRAGGGGAPGGGNVGTGNQGTGVDLLGAGITTGLAAIEANKAKSDAQLYANEYKDLAAPLGAAISPYQKSVASQTLMPGQQAQLNQDLAQQRAQSNQYFADAGVGGSQGRVASTGQLSMNQDIQNKGLIEGQQMLTDNFKNYILGFKEYSGVIDKSIQAGMKGDEEAMKLWDDVLGGLARSFTAGGGVSLGSLGGILEKLGLGGGIGGLPSVGGGLPSVGGGSGGGSGDVTTTPGDGTQPGGQYYTPSGPSQGTTPGDGTQPGGQYSSAGGYSGAAYSGAPTI